MVEDNEGVPQPSANGVAYAHYRTGVVDAISNARVAAEVDDHPIAIAEGVLINTSRGCAEAHHRTCVVDTIGSAGGSAERAKVGHQPAAIAEGVAMRGYSRGQTLTDHRARVVDACGKARDASERAKVA